MMATPGPVNDSQKQTDNDGDCRGAKRRSRVRGLATVLGILVVIYMLVGFIGVPALIRSVIVPRIGDELGGASAFVARASFNPLTGFLVLQDLRIYADTGAEAGAGTGTGTGEPPVAGFARLEINLQIWATIFRAGYRGKNLLVVEPTAHLEISESGKINLLRLVPDRTEDSQSLRAEDDGFTLPRVIIEGVEIRRLAVDAIDRSPRATFSFRVKDLSLSLAQLDTAAAHGNRIYIDAQLTDGSSLDTDLVIHLDPLSVKGRINLHHVPLPHFMPYVAEVTKAVVEDGRLDLHADIELSLAPGARVLRAEIPALTLRTTVVTLDGAPLIGFERVHLEGVVTDLEALKLSIVSIDIEGPAVHLLRHADGSIAVEAALSGPANDAHPVATNAADVVGVPPHAPLPELVDRVRPVLEAISRIAVALAGDWTLSTEFLSIRDGSATLQDDSVTPAAHSKLTDITLTAGGASSDGGWEIPFNLSHLANGAEISVQGLVAVEERTGHAEVQATDLDLAPLRGYLPSPLRDDLPLAALRSGRSSIRGTFQWIAPDDAPTELAWSGDMSLDDFDFSDDAGEFIARLQRFAASGTAQVRLTGPDLFEVLAEGNIEIAGADLAGAPRELAIRTSVAAEFLETDGRAEFTMRNGTVQVLGDGHVHLTGGAFTQPQLARSASAAKITINDAEFDLTRRLIRATEVFVRSGAYEGSHPIASGNDEEQARIRIDLPVLLGAAPDAAATGDDVQDSRWRLDVTNINVSDGTLAIRDDAADPPMTIHADEISTTLSFARAAATSQKPERRNTLEIELSARAQSTGRVTVSGTIDANDPERSADLTIQASTLPIKPFEALVGRYLGYLVDRGRVSMQLPITIEEGEMRGTLQVELDAFHLGSSVPSPTAPSAPIRLGLSLLRDRNGLISLTIPIRGDLSDPEFSVGGVVWQAFMNVIVQAATSPFRMLANLFGGGDSADASRVLFEPGTDRLTAESLRGLDVLTRAMRERPALRVTMTHVSAPELDEPALRKAVLEEMITAQARESGRGSDSDANTRLWALRDLFAERFPDRMPPDPLTQPDGIPSPDELTRDLLESIDVPAERFAALHKSRMDLVRQSIVREGEIDEARVTVRSADAGAAASDEAPRVTFELE